MSSETNTNMNATGSSSIVAEALPITNEGSQEESVARKKQSRQGWKGPSKIRTPSSDGLDQPKSKEAELLDVNDKQGVSHQRRKSTANTPDLSNKNKSPNNGNTNVDKSSHRRGKSMANVGELQGVTAKNGNSKIKGSKDDSENKSEALESLQQIIASLKNLPAVPTKSQKSDESSLDPTSKHKRHESSAASGGKRPSAPVKQHKKGASVSFSFPLTTPVTASLKPIPDSEDGKPMNIENALQDTISSLRRMSLDKGKTQKDRETDKSEEYDETEEERKARRKKSQNNKKPLNLDDAVQTGDKKQELDSPRSPFDFRKPSDEQPSASKKTHRRHQSLGHTLSMTSSPAAVSKVNNIPTHNRRHSVALNGSKDVLKELEKSQSRSTGADAKGHRRNNSRNFESNWRTTASPLSALAQPFQPFPLTPKFGAIQKKQQQNQQNSGNQTRKSLFAPYLAQANLPQLLKSGQLVSGVLRINKRNRSDAYVTTESLDADIYICGSKDRNRALEGDVVAVELLDPEKKVDKKKDDVEVEGQGLLLFEDDDIVTDEQRPKYCGHVVAVMERMPGQLFSGTLALLRPSSTATKEREAAEKARREAEERAAGIEPRVEDTRDDRKDEKNERPKIVWFKPTDKRVPLIAIPTEQAPSDFVENHQSYSQQLFVLGEIGSVDVETEALLKDNNVTSEEFGENITKSLPIIPWNISEKDIELRRDLRSIRIFTIDPSTAKDIDDAISCSRLPDGNFEIGVHIADVSHFVKPNSPLDREARKRATTVYLVQKSVSMLPSLLSEELCSLNPGVQSVIEGNPLNSEVEIHNEYVANEIEADIKVFHGLSQRLREHRHKRGTLSLGSISLKFDLDEDDLPLECNVYESKDANRLIEEFMLLANISVAQKISSAFPEQALLRRHAVPIERRLNDFVEHAERLGYNINTSSAGALQRSLDAVEDEDAKEVLKLLAIKPMQKAKYFCTGTLDIVKYHHYALNVPLYTHFTSPIRRYADVLVHRMLEAALSGEKRFYLDKDTVQKTAQYCNVKKEAARNAQEQSNHLFLCVLLNNLTVQQGPVIREAIVVGVKDHAFDVLVPVFGIEKRVHLDQLPLEKFVFNEETGQLILYWKPGVSSLEPISEDYGVGEDEEEGLDVDEDALLADVNDDYHYEMMGITTMPTIESPATHIQRPENASFDRTSLINASPLKASPPIVKIAEIPQLPIDVDPSIPNSQIIRELSHLNVVITADCKKSPPVIK
ncbi:4725_t:CDS:10, partial [Acaulospora colombiana]